MAATRRAAAPRAATATSSTSPRACARVRGARAGVATGRRDACSCAGSTAAVTTMEHEPGGVADLQAAARAPDPARGATTSTTRRNADTNAHAHLRAALIGPVASRSRSSAAALALGTWQQVVLIDFDDRPRDARPSSSTVAGLEGRAPRWRRGDAILPEAAPARSRGETPSGRALYSSVRSETVRCSGRAERRSPLRGGAAVFENSTACAPDGRIVGRRVRPGSTVRSVAQRSSGRGGSQN